MKRVAIILAGGSGSRIGGVPKQLLEINGKPIIAYTIEAFEHSSLIDEICIVAKENTIEEIRNLVETNQYGKVRHIIKGGKERSDSSMAALSIYTDANDILLFHDAARPLVSEQIIERCIEAMNDYDAAGTAVPSTDTIWQANSGIVAAIPQRATLYNAQTPQCFRRHTIAEAYRLAILDRQFRATDDCGVVNRYLPQTEIKIVEGESRNIKITYRQDLQLMQQLLDEKTQQP